MSAIAYSKVIAVFTFFIPVSAFAFIELFRTRTKIFFPFRVQFYLTTLSNIVNRGNFFSYSFIMLGELWVFWIEEDISVKGGLVWCRSIVLIGSWSFKVLFVFFSLPLILTSSRCLHSCLSWPLSLQYFRRLAVLNIWHGLAPLPFVKTAGYGAYRFNIDQVYDLFWLVLHKHQWFSRCRCLEIAVALS